jgi:predicted O-methyltransferase YrrM
LNKQSAGKLKYLGRFLHFLPASGNRYAVHAPYLYDFIGQVLRKDLKMECFRPVEKLRKEFLSGSASILKTDFGHRALQENPRVYEVKLSKVASTSLSSPSSARRLYRLARHINAEQTLEIGTSLGFTAAYLGLANPNGKVITLEGCPELSRIAGENHQKLKLTNIEIINGRFEQTLPEALARLGRIDLVYIDGNHQKEAMIDYFERCLPYCHNETVMVFDDIHASAGMEEAWAYVTKRKEISVSLDLFFSGWIFFRKESSKQHFKLRYF